MQIRMAKAMVTIKTKDTTEWKGNKSHPFNSRRGRLKGPKNSYTIWGLNLIVSSEKVFLVLFCSRRTDYIVRDNCEKIFISRFILPGPNIIFKNSLDVRCILRKIK